MAIKFLRTSECFARSIGQQKVKIIPYMYLQIHGLSLLFINTNDASIFYGSTFIFYLVHYVLICLVLFDTLLSKHIAYLAEDKAYVVVYDYVGM